MSCHPWANCESCYLSIRREGDLVQAEGPTDAPIIVGEFPEADDIETGRPFTGADGRELSTALNVFGAQRPQFRIIHALPCRPPGGELQRIMVKLKAENKARKAKDLPPYPTPLECCTPRIHEELRRSDGNVILLGKLAIQGVTRDTRSIFDLRGGPIDGWLDPDLGYADARGAVTSQAKPLRLLPTLAPSHVVHARMYQKVFRTDIGRALRWFAGKRNWVDPVSIIQPSPAQVKAFVRRKHRFVAFDFETEMADPTIAKIYCLGIGTPDEVLVIPFLSKETGNEVYPPGQKEEILAYLKEFYTDPTIQHVGHNSKVFDAVVMKSRWGFVPAKHLDTLALHRVVEPELHHNLYFVGTNYTDVHAWKADHAGTDATSDRELLEYNAIDIAVTARIVEPLVEAVKLRDQVKVTKNDHRVLDMCAGLKTLGMKVDIKKRNELDHAFHAQFLKYRQKARDAVGIATFNPNSTRHVADVLFEKWGLPPVEISQKTGMPSTGDDTLREFRLNFPLTPQQKVFIESLRRCRLYAKLRGTEVIRFRLPDEKLPEDEAWSTEELDFDPTKEFYDEVDAKRKDDDKKRPLLLADGRCHASWNQLTVSGRLSCNSPNLMNRKAKYRDMFIPEPYCPWCKEPHVYVGADMDQLELRFGAAWWGLENYLNVFAMKRDPHTETALAAFGDEGQAIYDAACAWAKANGKKPKEYKDFSRIRDFAKTLWYACAAKGTRVITLGSEGSKPIEDIIPGKDFTWCWDGTRYAPTLITEKKRIGIRRCVKVTLGWGRGNRNRSVAIFTPDHRFMRRDGTYVEAGKLRVGDSLMPFGRYHSGKYRMLDVYNDGGRTNEHRVALGLYPGDMGTVHHLDRNGKNNDPSNLRILGDAVIHGQKHWEEDEARREALRLVNEDQWSEGQKEATNARLIAGRLQSPAWREAHRVAFQKMREGLARARAEGHLKGWVLPSRLDAFRESIGVLRDAEVAELAGMTPEAVAYYRHKRNIPAPPHQRKNHVVLAIEDAGEHEVWDLSVAHEAHNFAIEAGVFVHNCQYAAEEETVHKLITSVEDDEGNLVYAQLSREVTSSRRQGLLDANPEMPRGWDRDLAFFRKHHYIQEPVWGRKRDCLNGEAINEIVNFPAQSGSIAIVHEATFKLLEAIPFQKWCPTTGLVNQCHDALVFEVPASKAEWCKSLMNEAMVVDGKEWGLNMKFTAGATIGPNWLKVK